MLFVVPTPVGNLEDITLRALRLFEETEIVITEDGRQTSKLFQLLKIKNKPKFINITKNHSLNLSEINQCLDLLHINLELKVILVSDAGTPGISDPGLEVILLAIQKQILYTVLPGATALIPAIVSSGLISKEFVFLGFLPIKKGRQSSWKEIANEKRPVVIYESVHRLSKFILECEKILQPQRQICICKDISKLHETIWRGKVNDLKDLKLTLKGEFVVIIEGFK